MEITQLSQKPSISPKRTLILQRRGVMQQITLIYISHPLLFKLLHGLLVVNVADYETKHCIPLHRGISDGTCCQCWGESVIFSLYPCHHASSFSMS